MLSVPSGMNWGVEIKPTQQMLLFFLLPSLAVQEELSALRLSSHTTWPALISQALICSLVPNDAAGNRIVASLPSGHPGHGCGASNWCLATLTTCVLRSRCAAQTLCPWPVSHAWNGAVPRARRPSSPWCWVPSWREGETCAGGMGCSSCLCCPSSWAASSASF